MSKHIQVDGHPSLVRDRETGAILNINKASIRAARQAKQSRKISEERLDRMEARIDKLTELLHKLVEKNG